MKTLFKKFPNLIALALILLVAFAMTQLGAPLGVAILFVACWQLLQIACVKRRRFYAGVLYTTAMSEPQIEEFQEILRSFQSEFPKVRGLADKFTQLQASNDELRREVARIKKSSIGSVGNSGVRWIGNVPFVTEDCAKALTSTIILGCSQIEGKLETIFPSETKRKQMLEQSREFYGAVTRGGGALSPTDIPLPTIYMPQIVELVFAFGQARQFATVFPLGAGTVKLPRLQAGEDTFGYLGVGTAGMSQNVPQKEVTAQLVTFTANKAGGLIRIPTELEEDTFIAMGQFLARYIARQLAKLEDNTLFNADGTGTYANITGIAKYCTSNPAYLQSLAATKTIPTQATVNDFRALRTLVNPAVLFNMAANGQTSAAYYMHPSMEALLVTFNTINNPFIYERPTAGQPAKLDGFPIRWIGVSQPYSQAAAPAANLAFFGDLSFWYLGERGVPRVEISREVFFQTDELAMRALERIDVEAMAVDAMATLQTAAQ
jgi:HK97 family phage major capsid protein